jgi:hypothetical protein
VFLILSIGLKHGLKGIEASRPIALIEGEPRLRIGERGGVEPAMMGATANGSVNESGALEDPNVFRGGRERHCARCRKLCDCPLAAGETTEHIATCRIRESSKHAIKTARISSLTGRRARHSSFNHVVQNIRNPPE